MCGIAGYVGFKVATPFVLESLQKLEYRGYDSAGLAYTQNNNLCRLRVVGGVKNLERETFKDVIFSSTMIGHTRWATHGKVCVANAHPQLSNAKDVAVVHNGIVENFEQLKTLLAENGTKFESQTDTEIIPNLMHTYLRENTNQGILDALHKTTKRLQGSYALCVLVKGSDNIFVTSHFSPLVLSKSDAGCMVASDISALPQGKLFKLPDDFFAVLSKDDVSFFDQDLNPTKLDALNITNIQQNDGLGGFKSYMEKEINQGGSAIRQTCQNPTMLNILDTMAKQLFLSPRKVVITACGTALHAGRILGFLLKKECGIECVVDYASEFRYFPPHLDTNTVCIFISQSGETADTLSCLELAKSKNAHTVGITNVPTSRLAGMVDFCILTSAGAECAVASTKAFMAQLAVAYLMTQKICQVQNKQCEFCAQDVFDCADMLNHLNTTQTVDEIVKTLKGQQSLYVLGRGLDYTTAQEGALKIKEVSYIHCEALPLGELKHGSLALFNKDTFCFVVMTQKHLATKTINNIHEIKSRGAHVVLLTNLDVEVEADFVLKIKCKDCFSPIFATKILQLIALNLANAKNIDVDKPRNLAKSVTVE